MPEQGTIYLLHFNKPYHHARHYIGWTRDLEKRIARHKAGQGARLIEVITQAGIAFTVAKTWQGSRDDERHIKNTHNAPRLCPICKKEHKG